MFQGYKSYLKIESKKNKGLNLSSSDDSVKIKNIQNIIKTSFGDFRTRYRCFNLHKFEHLSDPIVQFNDCLKTMSFVRKDGDIDLLVYVTYFANLYNYTHDLDDNDKDDVIAEERKNQVEHIKNILDYSKGAIEVKKDPKDQRRTNFTIKLDVLSDVGIKLFERYFFEDVQIGIMQSSLNRTPYINNFIITDKIATFDCNVRVSQLDIDEKDERGRPLQQFHIYPHRAGIFRLEKTKIYNDEKDAEQLIDNLDPNVIVNYINYRNALVILNGVDRNMFYKKGIIETMYTFTDISWSSHKIYFVDSKTIRIEFLYTYKGDSKGQIERSKRDWESIRELTTLLLKPIEDESIVSLISLFSKEVSLKTESISEFPKAYTPGESEIGIEIKLKDNFAEHEDFKIRQTMVKKYDLPVFNFITVSRDRMWALSGGRVYKNKHRDNRQKMLVYYSYERLSLYGWANRFTGNIEYLNTESKNPVPDCLEAIYPYRDTLLFVGREYSQVWSGDSPLLAKESVLSEVTDIARVKVLKDGDLFKWQSTIKVGILNQNMIIPMDNELLFINKNGLSTVDTNNIAKNLIIKQDVNIPLGGMFTNDYQNIRYESQFRNMFAFNYSFGDLIGFKLSSRTYIISSVEDGFYTIFTGKFSEAKQIDYDNISKTLFLSLGNGLVDVYNDKKTNNSKDYWLIKNAIDEDKKEDEERLHWNISFNWLAIGETWYNDCVMMDFKAGEFCKVKLDIRTDNNSGVIFENKVQQEMNKETTDAIIAREIPYRRVEDMLNFENKNISHMYDEAPISAPFAYTHKPFNYVFAKFSADNISLSVSGKNYYCYFTAIYLCGGKQSDQQ